MSKLEIFGVAALAVTAGALYVLVHEARRKHKKAIKLAAEEPISKEMLLKILNKSAEASKTVIERVRTFFSQAQQHFFFAAIAMRCDGAYASSLLFRTLMCLNTLSSCSALLSLSLSLSTDPRGGAQGAAGKEPARRPGAHALPAEL
jgi:hypothetical protein